MATRSKADGSAWDLMPARPTMKSLAEAASGCRACELWERATQTVFGEGSPRAEVMMVGEQPGDHEDMEGHPLVGPAGRCWTEPWTRPGSTGATSTS